MKRITVHDKTFELSIPFSEIDNAIAQISVQMDHDLKGKDVVMLCILNGSFMFAADLMKKLTTPCRVTFVKVTSYQGTSSEGKVKELIGLNEDLKGKTVVILEDIVDTGRTIQQITKTVLEREPSELKIATMLFKPTACLVPVNLDYVGLEIPDDYIIGYGLDYDGFGRNLPDMYTLVK